MVHHLEVAAELLVFLADGVHAVRAGSDDQLGLHFVQRGDVGVRELAVQVLVAGAAGAVAGAALALAEHREVDAGVVEELHEGARGLLRLRIVAGRAAHPEQDVRLRILVGRRTFRPSAQSRRLSWLMPQGFLRAPSRETRFAAARGTPLRA